VPEGYGEPESGRIGDSENEAEHRREGFSFTDSPFRRFSVSSPEECFQKAIEIAQKQQAKSLELRATVSLARLWQQHGKTTEAHEVLAEIYGWFTEGFDTADLQEAKALIEELSH
jgi:predicted ATPase